MASSDGARSQALPHLEPSEVALLEFVTVARNNRRDILSLSDKEAHILQLYDQIQEQELEKALLEQGTQLSNCNPNHPEMN
jgi:hypothetical protein